MNTLPTYKPSGTVAWARLWRLPIIAVPLTVVLGWVYALALLQASPVFVAPFVSFLLATVLTVIAMTVAAKMHSRRPNFNRLLGLGLATLVLWIRWLVTFRAASIPLAVEFASSSPVAAMQMIWQYGIDRAAHDPGAFSPTVSALWWALEAAFVVLLTNGLVASEARKPYSESLGRWAKEEAGGEVYLANVSADEFRRRLADRGVSTFLSLQHASLLAATPLASTWSTARITGHRVEGDPDAYWLSVALVSSKRTPEGKVRSDTNDVVQYWTVSEADYRHLMAYLHESEGAAPHSAGMDEYRPMSAALKRAVDALENGAPDVAMIEATPHLTHPSADIRADAHRVVALACSRLERWGEAYEGFLSLFALEPTAHNALQLATTAVMDGDLARGESWLSRSVSMNDDKREMPLPTLRTAYLSALERAGQFAACEPPLVWLRTGYERLGSTDSQQLWSHQLPIFSEFLTRAGAMLAHTLPPEAWHAWFEHMRPYLDAGGEAALNVHLLAQSTVTQPQTPIYLYEHYSRGHIVVFDPWRSLRTPFTVPEYASVSMNDCIGSYMREGNRLYAAFWQTDCLKFYAEHVSLELLKRDENGNMAPLHDGLSIQFGPVGADDPSVRDAYSTVSITAQGRVLFETTYESARYAYMASMDFTAASMFEDLSDWDFFVWLAQQVNATTANGGFKAPGVSP